MEIRELKERQWKQLPCLQRNFKTLKPRGNMIGEVSSASNRDQKRQEYVHCFVSYSHHDLRIGRRQKEQKCWTVQKERTGK